MLWWGGCCSLSSSPCISVIIRRMMASSSSTCQAYEEAVKALNTTLISNTQMRNESVNTEAWGEYQLEIARGFVNRIGIQVADIDRLNQIHVAGTKGKGSVSAMCESILRAKGYKTGFFSSPHLLEARERIRINGTPISKESFVKYFWEVFNQLKSNHEHELPFYFLFMCLMSYKVFIEEKVDVAVVEVGIGGSYDPTNIVRHPKVCAVTSLGYDHTDMLGKTLSEIAWHKSGIFKPGSPAITAPQTTEALEVIRERAKELGSSSLFVSPQYTSYPNHVTTLGIDGDHQFINASLAVQVCKSWLDQMDKENYIPNETLQTEKRPSLRQQLCGVPVAEPFILPREFIKGLQRCTWPGRCQIIKRRGVTYFMDGAHTNESIRCCAQWFKKASVKDSEENKCSNVVQVLMFSVSGKRDFRFLLEPLTTLPVHHSIFCPYIITNEGDDSSNLLLRKSRENALLWKQLHDSIDGVPQLPSEPLVFESISKAIQWIHESVSQPDTHVQVLVCGMFLVGGVMKYLGYNTDSIT